MARTSLPSGIGTRLTAFGDRWRGARWLRLLTVTVVLATVVAVVLAVLPGMMLDTAAARQNLVARLSKVTGQTVSIDGDVSFSMLPRTRLIVDRVRIGEDNPVSIDRIVADLDPGDAIAGRATISRLLLIRPEYRMAQMPSPSIDGGSDPAGGLSLPRRMARVFLGRFHGLQILEVRDGVLRPEPGARGSGFSNASFTATQAGDGAAMQLSGSFIWNGQPTDVALSIDSPDNLAAGKSSRTAFDIASPPLSTSFDGQLSLDRNAVIKGRIKVSSSSLARGLEWLTNTDATVPDLGPVSLDGDLLLAGLEANVQNADVSISGSSGSGALEADFGSKIPFVGGTLAFARLDLDPLVDTIAPFPQEPYDFERPIDIGFARTVGLDIRLSAGEAALGDIPITNMAAVLSVGGGKAKFEVGDAGVFDGRGQATMVFDAADGQPTFDGRMALSNVDMSALLKGMKIRGVVVSGRSDLTARLGAPFRSWGTLVRKAELRTYVDVRNGTISGFDPSVFSRPGALPLRAGAKGATVPFDSLHASLDAHGAKFSLKSMSLVNSAGTLEATGRFSAFDQTVALAGTFEQSGAQGSLVREGSPSPTGPIAFAMRGRWPNPSVTTR